MAITTSTIPNTLTAILGSDLMMPINGSFQVTSGIPLLLQDIQILLLTVPGQRTNRPTFGCNLQNQIWENIDSAATNGAGSIRAALSKFEPRIKVNSVNSTINRNTDLITFTTNFVILTTNTPVNLIFPFRAGINLSFA
jgi:phage baseplate assembly protein W